MRTIASALPAAIVAVVVSNLAGCAEVAFHAAGSTSYPANPPNCSIRLLAADPGSDFEEIGLLTVDGTYAATTYRDPDIFMNDARDQVCQAGGEVVVTQVNGFGSIVRGVVFRRRSAQAARAETNAPCDPICSPGFSCKKSKCVPLCNPACEHGEVCGRDRVCHGPADSSVD